MLCGLGSDTFLLEHAEEVLRLQEGHGELFLLGFDILVEGDVLEELLGRHTSGHQLDHEHDHDLD